MTNSYPLWTTWITWDNKWNCNTTYNSWKVKWATTIGFIRRSIHPNLNRLRAKAYKQLLRPIILEHAITPAILGNVTIWITCRDEQRGTVKNIPLADWESSEVWNEPLQVQRKQGCLGLSWVLHHREAMTTSRTPGQKDRAVHMCCSTNSHECSLFIATAKLWNSWSVNLVVLYPPVLSHLNLVSYLKPRMTIYRHNHHILL